MKYGLPYKGSKNLLAEKIIQSLPSAKHFYDLFGGGGAISHCALLSGKYKYVHYNELDPLVFKGFQMAVNGEFKDERRWISREDFNKLKDSDPYVAFCFSFGNNLKDYAYNKECEKFKKAVHYFICFNDDTLLKEYIDLKNFKFLNDDLHDKRIQLQRYLMNYIDDVKKYVNYVTVGKPRIVNMSENLERLENIDKSNFKKGRLIQNLERFKRLESLNNLKNYNIILTNNSYDELEIEDNAIIYCDPPYLNTSEYRIKFDNEKFYNWCKKYDNVFISEYTMPNDFKVLKSFEFSTRFAQNKKNVQGLKSVKNQ